MGETREKPIEGKSLMISLDVNIQEFAQQSALKVMEEKQAERVSILLMNPQNGEIYACVNVPEFDLNDPFTLTDDLNMQLNESGITIPSEDHNEQSELAVQTASGKTNTERKQELLNQMWRNPCLNDTYEPGSTFKIITMAAGLEAGVVSPGDRFYCPGYKVVEDRRIHCAKRTGHGSQNFVEGAQNSCNPVFIEVGLRLGIERYYKYFRQFGLLDKTGTDLPGEAGTIMHNPKNNGRGGACHGILWSVVSDHTDPACNNRQWDHQWRKPDHTSFWDQRGKCGRNKGADTGISGGKRDRVR